MSTTTTIITIWFGPSPFLRSTCPNHLVFDINDIKCLISGDVAHRRFEICPEKSDCVILHNVHIFSANFFQLNIT